MLMRYWRAFTDKDPPTELREGCSRECSGVKVSASMSVDNKLPLQISAQISKPRLLAA
jgi:hypothetical protein